MGLGAKAGAALAPGEAPGFMPSGAAAAVCVPEFTVFPAIRR